MDWEELYSRLFSTPTAPTTPAAGAVTFPQLPDPLPFDTSAIEAQNRPTFLSGLYSDWRDFLETQRQFQQQSAENQRQFNFNLGANLLRDQENIRQFNRQFDESARRFDWETGYIPRRDAYSIAGAAFLPQTRFLTR